MCKYLQTITLVKLKKFVKVFETFLTVFNGHGMRARWHVYDTRARMARDLAHSKRRGLIKT